MYVNAYKIMSNITIICKSV